jgi:GxxExxY protein
MDSDEHKSDDYLKEETYTLIGFAMKLLNTVGHGFHEKTYENGLVVDFTKNSIQYSQQTRLSIEYEREEIAKFIPDLIAFEKIIVDTKTIDRISDHERGQMLNYLKVTCLCLGLLLNFKNPKLEFERIIYNLSE